MPGWATGGRPALIPVARSENAIRAPHRPLPWQRPLSTYEGVRQGNIHFAVEHCSTNFQGFMEGGASEGVRAASEILADLKKL